MHSWMQLLSEVPHSKLKKKKKERKEEKKKRKTSRNPFKGWFLFETAVYLENMTAEKWILFTLP